MVELAEAKRIAGIAREQHDAVSDFVEWLPAGIADAESAITDIQMKREAVIIAALITKREEDGVRSELWRGRSTAA